MSSTQGGAIPNYEAAVAEARILVKRSEADQWRLAELTWEQIEAGKSRREWARDIDIHNSHATRLYLVWQKYGAAGRDTRPSYTDAYSEFASSVPREERGARQALADPEAVRQAIIENPEIRKAAIHALADHESDEGQLGQALSATRQATEDEWAPTLWMSRVLALLSSGTSRFDPEEVFRKVRPHELESWERSLDLAVPFLQEVRRHLTRRTAKVELLR